MLKIVNAFFIIVSLGFNSGSHAQINNLNVGAVAGVGAIKGNSPSITSLAGGVNFGFTIPAMDDMSFRVGFLHARKIEYFLPESRRGKYYPFMTVLSLKSFIRQSLSENIFLEEGAGLILINDRTFSDVNEWDSGLAINLLTGYDWRGIEQNGFTAGAGLEYGITFTYTTASYFIFYLQSQFYF